jgi:hypothetical protein
VVGGGGGDGGAVGGGAELDAVAVVGFDGVAAFVVALVVVSGTFAHISVALVEAFLNQTTYAVERSERASVSTPRGSPCDMAAMGPRAQTGVDTCKPVASCDC